MRDPYASTGPCNKRLVFQATLEFHDGAEVAQGIYPDMDGKISRE
jgi:hypothetical protein